MKLYERKLKSVYISIILFFINLSIVTVALSYWTGLRWCCFRNFTDPYSIWWTFHSSIVSYPAPFHLKPKSSFVLGPLLDGKLTAHLIIFSNCTNLLINVSKTILNIKESLWTLMGFKSVASTMCNVTAPFPAGLFLWHENLHNVVHIVTYFIKSDICLTNVDVTFTPVYLQWSFLVLKCVWPRLEFFHELPNKIFVNSVTFFSSCKELFFILRDCHCYSVNQLIYNERNLHNLVHMWICLINVKAM